MNYNYERETDIDIRMIDHDCDPDINISGYIDAERKSSPKLLLPIKEALHNSLEAIRLARLQDNSVKAKIIIMFYIQQDILIKFGVFDKATKFTGIKNLRTKKIYKLYHHDGIKIGFSEYGIGSKLENLRCCNIIEHHTITDTGIYEKTKWDISRSIEENNLLNVIEYEQDPQHKILSKYDNMENNATGTLLLCSEILPRLKNKDTTDYIINIDKKNSLYNELCNHIINYDKDNINIEYKVFNNNFNEPSIVQDIFPNNMIANSIKTFEIICCENKKTSERDSFIIDKPENNDYANFDNFNDYTINSLNNFIINDEDTDKKYISYYNGQETDKLSTIKPKKMYTISQINNKYHISSKIKFICSTAEKEYEYDEEKDSNKKIIKDSDKMGFYGIREVEGRNMVRTTIDPIYLKWKKLTSHKTRYTQFRGIIHYDRNSDSVLESDKSKSLSDDRPIDPSLRFNILKLADEYISKMKTYHGDYDTENKQKHFSLEPEIEQEEDEPEIHIKHKKNLKQNNLF
jgi:hypothetical protein